jgi:GTP-binding protein HflX
MKFESDPVEEHAEVPLPDDGRWEELIDEWSKRRDRPEKPEDGKNACYVVSSGSWRSPEHRDAQLGEILGLVKALGDEVVGHESLRLSKPHPKTWFGTGTCEAISTRARAAGANLLVVDAELSPSQTRNLEDLTGLAVQDREGVILAVFHRNARSRKARIQVEIAQLEYLRPRIRGLGLDMDQQAGGIMGGKGAGETASELMARRIDDRLVQLRRTFQQVQRAGELQRKRRDNCERIALVGYTNAGKTSLMNALTGADLSAKDQPFETLDTTSRALTRHGGDVLVGDTVGFIRELPARLMASFESTLAEMREATLLVIVVDLSDPEWTLHLQITHGMITRLEADELARFYVFNKADRVADIPHARLAETVSPHPYAVLSAHDEEAVDKLREALIAQARGAHRTVTMELPYAAGAVTAEIYATCRVLDTTSTDTGLRMTFQGPPQAVARIERLAKGVKA